MFKLTDDFKEGEPIILLDEGIRMLLSDSEIKKRFTRTYADNIFASTAASAIR